MLLTFSDSTPLANYKILSNSITPRPIAWVNTISRAGVINIAPFSFFSPLCATPVIFGINIMNKSNGEPKDTLVNAKLTKVATISTVQPQFLECMQQTSTELPYNIGEADKYNIPLETLSPDFPPMVHGTLVAFFCEFRDILHFSETQATLILEAKEVFIDDSIYTESLNFTIQNIGRVGKGFV
ncbi:hypothetical protein CQA53_05490 [Helicobacter didelphidarum]|uniref:Flavin reductase like domain-containing protein n=1 Tax=Helicobacter didelphidarum TaxID=2040648 RepID=A0A3D8IL31_9HELI|nr:flavin reductase [Helicobacter didelphidarum]RDU65898.1 hypothetical protein CQA53_05490 [Helicobacter didelphidarum]